jgi:hypothetical protein
MKTKRCQICGSSSSKQQEFPAPSSSSSSSISRVWTKWLNSFHPFFPVFVAECNHAICEGGDSLLQIAKLVAKKPNRRNWNNSTKEAPSMYGLKLTWDYYEQQPCHSWDLDVLSVVCGQPVCRTKLPSPYINHCLTPNAHHLSTFAVWTLNSLFTINCHLFPIMYVPMEVWNVVTIVFPIYSLYVFLNFIPCVFAICSLRTYHISLTCVL